MCSSYSSGAPEATSGNGSDITFRIELQSGSRPVVAGSMNGVKYNFQVHSNAGFYFQTNHEKAALAGVSQLLHTGTYGIVSSGQLSALGRDEGTLPNLTIGDHAWSGVPASVFETPGAHSCGMLGLKWIEENKLIMDFPARTLRIRAKAPNIAEDYESLPMRRQEGDGRYVAEVTIHGVSRPMIVSTVAGLTIDTEFAHAARIGTGDVSGESGGPTGAVIERHRLDQPLQLSIGDWLSNHIEGEIEDIYSYMGQTRPTTGAVGGMLGADFLIEHRAVIDFGARCLYLARPKI